MFPAGSDKGETKALPTVWSDSAGFLAASKNADAAYDKLAVAAGSGDLAAVTAAFGDTGKACGACHDQVSRQGELTLLDSGRLAGKGKSAGTRRLFFLHPEK